MRIHLILVMRTAHQMRMEHGVHDREYMYREFRLELCSAESKEEE